MAGNCHYSQQKFSSCSGQAWISDRPFQSLVVHVCACGWRAVHWNAAHSCILYGCNVYGCKHGKIDNSQKGTSHASWTSWSHLDLAAHPWCDMSCVFLKAKITLNLLIKLKLKNLLLKWDYLCSPKELNCIPSTNCMVGSVDF